MRCLLLIAVTTAALAELSAPPASSGSYSSEALKDEIHHLPGAPRVHFRMFSGYIDVSAPDEAPGTRQMFYWFVESQSDPAADPVFLWTNGGPGCSGLAGFLTENGPFRPTHDGRRLKLNPFAWNKLANMVFIEQPMGVGFSHASERLSFGDAAAAADNLRFVTGFFARYPNYASRDFYLSSESYGGHYLPTLARAIEESGEVPQLRGVLLGNPLTWGKYMNYGAYGTAWGHQLIPQPLWREYESMGCKEYWSVSELRRLAELLNSTHTSEAERNQTAEEVEAYIRCWNVTFKMDSILNDFDQYALDFPVCASGSPLAAGRHERWTLQRALERASDPEGRTAARELEYQPCSMDFATTYLNQPEVQAAIGAVATNWSVCTQLDYNLTDVDADMTPIWRELVGLGKLQILIYSGDDDSVCPTMGTQEFLWEGLRLQPAERNWEAWKEGGQTAGFWTEFRTPAGGSFSFVTVHGAGHMVPSTQPARSLALLRRFLKAGREPDIVV